MPSYITPTKIGNRHFRIAFPASICRYHQETFRTGIEESHIQAVTCDFQQFSILTCVDPDKPVQSPFKLINSK